MMTQRRRVDIETTQIEACNYNEMASKSIVLNPAEIGRCIWIHLDPMVCPFTYVRAEEICTHKPVHEGGIERDGIVWLKVFSQELNLDVGYHAYKIVLYDCVHHVEVYQYISYIIQTPDAPKPYIYMHREDSES